MTGLHLHGLFNRNTIDYIIDKAAGYECSYPEPDVTIKVKKAACDYLLTCVWDSGNALDAMTQSKLVANITSIREGKPMEWQPCRCNEGFQLSSATGRPQGATTPRLCTECSLLIT